MPATDNLTTRHTPGTVPGSARPGWGLPYEQLPAATQRDLTPESFINEQIATGRQQIQQRFNLAWDEINRSARFIGRVKAGRMRQELHAKAKQEMLQFNQQAQQQMTQLQDIDRLAEQGMISNADEIKARIVFGADVAKSMYPRRREEDIPGVFGKLDIYSQRISDELDKFREELPKPPSKLTGISPLTAAVSMYRSSRKPKRKVKVWDPNTGDWRKTAATPEEIAEYDFWRQQEKAVAARKKEVAAKFGVGQRVVQPGTKGGTFDDKIAESVKPQQQRTAPKSKVIRQRNTRTGEERISYDGGKTWQTSG